jgi:hypothetical protein
MKRMFVPLVFAGFCACALVALAQTFRVPIEFRDLEDVREAKILSGHGYAAATTVSGGCSGGPIVSRNGIFSRFLPVDGSAEALLAGLPLASAPCWLTGLGYRSVDSSLYVVSATSGGQVSGSNAVYRINVDATMTPFAQLVDGSGKEFYVDELEFDGAGNAYLLAKGDENRVYRVPASQFKAGSITVGPAFYTVPGPQAAARPMALVGTGSPNRILVVFQATLTSPLLVREVDGITGASAFKPSHPKVGGWGPMTDDMSGYFHSGNLYIFRAETLYRMSAASSELPEVVGDLTTLAGTQAHDMAFIP